MTIQTKEKRNNCPRKAIADLTDGRIIVGAGSPATPRDLGRMSFDSSVSHAILHAKRSTWEYIIRLRWCGRTTCLEQVFCFNGAKEAVLVPPNLISTILLDKMDEACWIMLQLALQ